jgi:hypothetical protein
MIQLKENSMTMKASYISIFLACSLLVLACSLQGACLKRGLDPLPTFKDGGVNRFVLAINAIVGMCNVSMAANIKPVGDAPALGVPADFSKPAVYEVTAADAVTKKDWVLVTTLIK